MMVMTAEIVKFQAAVGEKKQASDCEAAAIKKSVT